ncbi:MAG TPA: DegT/DnrJ/EryC1/StrS family aminotransferase, partial [Phycisphaerae bacterium]|nr:DegT/DnrJ/EryC1/StrS family aminotransferase [Phycisphaerae bacterium]
MKTEKYDEILNFIRSLYTNETPVPLHAPRFVGNEKKYLAECIDTTFVSYVGKFVTDFEEHAKRITGAKYAIAMVNGTAALQMALLSAGVQPGDEVITQALTFVATAAAIKHAGAEPSFVDVDVETLGMSPDSLRSYLAANAEIRSGKLFNKKTGRHISAVVPMHTFGHPVRIDEILLICQEYNLMLIEDSAES